MKTSSYLPSKVRKGLEKFFDKCSITRLAKSSGFTLRKAKKITGYHFVVAFLLCCSKGRNTFSEWARQLTLLSGKSLSKQSLWERIHKGSAAFAQSLLQQLLLKASFQKTTNQLFSAFRRVLLQDSTTFRLPDSMRTIFPGNRVKGLQKAIARIQSIIEIKKMQLLDFALGAFTDNDQGASASIAAVVRKGDLLIRDLGYFSLAVFHHLIEQEVDFLSRLKYGVKLHDAQGAEIDVKKLLRKGEKVDTWVWAGAKNCIRVRLVLVPLPEGQAQERVRNAKKDRDKRLHHSKEYYLWLRYRAFITTVGENIWSTDKVADAYGVRWQIEIIFKSWKSSFHMQSLLHERCEGEYRVKTSIYLLLLFVCLFMQKVYMRYWDAVQKQSAKGVSLLKLSGVFFPNMVELLTVSPQKLKQHMALYGCYEKRKDRCNMKDFINSF